MNQLTSMKVSAFSSSEEALRTQFKSLRAQLDELLLSPIELQSTWAGDVTPERLTSTQIRYVLKARAWRSRIIGEDLFADPAWDMLLDLYAAHLDSKTVSVSSACHASNVPYTTALRWVTALHARQLVARESDPEDGRRVYLSLTPKAVSMIETYFSRFALPV